MLTDSDTQREIDEELRWEPSLAKHAIIVVVRDGVAMLSGRVDGVADHR